MEEASQLLSLESFSYRWLVDLKPALESRDDSLRASIDVSDEGSFIEMDPRSPPSKRFVVSRLKSNSLDFKFDFPVSQSPDYLVPADELFAEGFVLPLFMDPSEMKANEYSDSKPKLSSTKPSAVSKGKSKPVFSSWRKRNRRFSLSKRIFCKYLEFLRPMYCIIFRRGTRRAQATKKSVHPADESPKMSCSCSVNDWRYSSVDSESTIYEAVLHCKRSNGMQFKSFRAVLTI